MRFPYLVVILFCCSQHALFAQGQRNGSETTSMVRVPVTLTDIIENTDNASIVLLNRNGLNDYVESGKKYDLDPAEIHRFFDLLSDSTNFYGGTPLMFSFSSRIKLYAKDKEIASLDIAPNANKLMQNDFDIPYNRLHHDLTTGAVYWPFISNNFSQFLTQLESPLQ